MPDPVNIGDTFKIVRQEGLGLDPAQEKTLGSLMFADKVEKYMQANAELLSALSAPERYVKSAEAVANAVG